MHLGQNAKRIGLSFTFTVAMIALCAGFGAQSHHGHSARNHSAGARMPRAAGAAFHPRHGEHSMPWVENVVNRALCIASYLGA